MTHLANHNAAGTKRTNVVLAATSHASALLKENWVIGSGLKMNGCYQVDTNSSGKLGARDEMVQHVQVTVQNYSGHKTLLQNNAISIYVRKGKVPGWCKSIIR